MAVKNNTHRHQVKPQRVGFRWLVIISVIFCELLVYTWIRTESTQTILRISRAEQVMAEKSSYQKALLVERDRLKSDDRITQIARTHLNLSSETLNQTIYLPGEDG